MVLIMGEAKVQQGVNRIILNISTWATERFEAFEIFRIDLFHSSLELWDIHPKLTRVNRDNISMTAPGALCNICDFLSQQLRSTCCVSLESPLSKELVELCGN